MKKLILATILAVTSFVSVAGMHKGDADRDSLNFSEKVIRVCGVTVDGQDGSIVFDKETDGLNEVAATFTVVDNGAHRMGGQTLVSIDTKRVSKNLNEAGITKDQVKYSINTTDDARQVKRTPVWVDQKQEVYAVVHADADKVNTGVAKVKAVITVHCK